MENNNRKGEEVKLPTSTSALRFSTTYRFGTQEIPTNYPILSNKLSHLDKETLKDILDGLVFPVDNLTIKAVEGLLKGSKSPARRSSRRKKRR